MKTFYSLIKISPNTVAGDSSSVGLLVCSGNRFWLKFSEDKKNAAKRLVEDIAASVDFVVKQLTAYIGQLNDRVQQSKTELFHMSELLTSEYFEYLSRYANGLLQFSQPSHLQDDVNEEKFNKLFSLLIDKNAVEAVVYKAGTANSFYTTINEKLITKVQDTIHTRVTLNETNLQTLYFQYEMDCIGLNGAFVGAKAVPFTRTMVTLDKDISHYISLITLLSSQYKKDTRSNNFFLIANEPEGIKTPEHHLWERISRNSLFTVIPSEESGLVADKVAETGATRFLEAVQ